MTEPYFASLDAFRAHCGEPTMPLEQCPICSKIPQRCGRYTGADDPSDDTTPEIEQLVSFIDDGKFDGEILRCPTCRRLYFYNSQHYGNDIYYGNSASYSWERHDIDTLFDHPWCIKRRLPAHDVFVPSEQFFRSHMLVRLGSESWGALDHGNRLVTLDSRDAIDKLIDLDPLRVTDDLERAKRYAIFFDEIENPDDRRPHYWQFVGWNEVLTAEEEQQIADARTAAKLDDRDMLEQVERDGDRVVVRMWVASQKRLICRVMTVQPNGRYIREDAVIAENLPIR